MLALLAILAASLQADDAAAFDDAATLFTERILPVLEEHCFECHTRAGGMDGDLRLDTPAGMLDGGRRGPAIVPGEPEESLLMRALSWEHDELWMPPDDPLAPETVADFRRWIELGAPWPAGAAAEDELGWSYQPMADPEPPAGEAPDPIDRYLDAGLAEAGLSAAPPADRPTLLRRVTLSLTGLPPTPEELADFLQDESQDAWEQVVERLLGSSAYGEAWGRRWLDLVRYADTAGDSSDYPVEDAWRYRNWVIDALNRDVPYDEFLRLQVAGDLLDGPEDEAAERVIATGFLALARRYGVGRDADPHLIIADQIDTLGRAVLGATLACARCHDHKADPFSTESYYGLYGILASTQVPFPGSENEKRPERLVPIVIDGEAATAYAAQAGEPQTARVHIGGNPHKKGERVPHALPAALTPAGYETRAVEAGFAPDPDQDLTGRLALARWLTDPEHPRTARVIVNRVWEGHFGVGLVDTPSDLGAYGSQPSHPELLDWLARRFVEDGWSLKALHRRILSTAAYRRSARGPERAVRIDPENRLLGRFAPRRLRAEELRDALLALSGALDREPGGPHPFPPRDKWNWTQHRPFFDVYHHDKRSVYLMTQRLKRHPFLALFDGPDTNQSTARRGTSVVPAQALWLRHDPWVDARAAEAAARWQAAAEHDHGRVDAAFRAVYARPAGAAERDELCAWVAAERAHAAEEGAADPDLQAWRALARVLFASNEFLYID